MDSGKQYTSMFKIPRLYWLAIIALVAVSFLLWWFMFTPDHPSVPVNTDGKDSPLTDKPNVVDSISPPKEKTEDQKQKDHKPEIADTSKNGAELFAANFTPYKDKAISPVSHGNNDLSPIDQFRTYYWNGQYKEAIKTFSTLGPQYQNNDNLRFVYANALAVEGDYEVAQLELTNIIDHKKSIYLDEAHWYLGLLYMQQGEMANAGKLLQKCVAAPEGKHKKEAKELLEKIK
jgi:tetratricopeptide (TPR) repeat protein